MTVPVTEMGHILLYKLRNFAAYFLWTTGYISWVDTGMDLEDGGRGSESATGISFLNGEHTVCPILR